MPWLFWIGWFLLTAGGTKLSVSLVNRLSAIRLHKPALKAIRGLHDLLLLIWPLGMIYGLGFTGPKLATATGNWSAIPWAWWPLFGLATAGFVMLVSATCRYQFRQLPADCIAATSRVLDVRQVVGPSVLGSGPHRSLATLPINEQFTIELTEYTLQLDRLPTAWNGLTILHLSDLHFYGAVDRPFYERVIDEARAWQPDLVCFTGDLLDRLECVEWVQSTLARLRGKLGNYFVLGNHDWYHDTARIRHTLRDAGWIDVAGQCVSLPRQPTAKDQEFVVLGTELPWMSGPPEPSTLPAAAFRLLLSHSPDQIQWARAHHMDLMLAGHTHGGQIQLPLFGPVYCPSWYDTRYANGLFWEDPTMLVVSRGVSGREPLRISCRPEISRLTLVSRTSPTGTASS